MHTVDEAAGIASAEVPASLWTRDFFLLTTGETISTLGGTVASFAFPLIILAYTKSPADAGLVAMAGTLGNVGGSAVVGGWVDGHSRRAGMVVSLAVRALSWSALAILVGMSRVYVPLFAGLAFVGGGAAALYAAAEAGALKIIVAKEQFPAAVSVVEGRGAVADVAGTPLGGLVLSLSALVPLWLNAASYVASLIGVLGIRADLGRPHVEDRQGFGRRMKEGLRFIWRQPAFRPVLIADAAGNLGMNGFIFATVLILRQGGRPYWAIGLVQACIGVSILAGSFIAPGLVRRVPVGGLLVGSAVLRTAILILVTLLYGNLVAVLVLLTLGYVLVPASNSGALSYLAVVTPHRYQGSVAAAEQFASNALLPLTVVGAGFLVGALAPGAALGILCAIVAAGTLVMLSSGGVRRLPHLVRAPESGDTEVVDGELQGS